MNTVALIESFLELYQRLNTFEFDFQLLSHSSYSEFTLNFKIPVQTVQMYSLLYQMLMERVIVSLVDGYKISILIYNLNESC